MPDFATSSQRGTYTATVRALRSVGYSEHLLEEDYTYPDWFAQGEERTIAAAAFGRTPPSYDTALFAIDLSDGEVDDGLANRTRALGAPILLEVEQEHVTGWAIGANQVERRERFSPDGFTRWVDDHRAALEPRELLRTKSLGAESHFYRQHLFAGLIEELEESIADSLQPLLRAAFTTGRNTYERITGTIPSEPRLFTTTFWILTGKVFADRRHPDFLDFVRGGIPDVDEVLDRVAMHYSEPRVRHLNRQTREAIIKRVWSKMDFRNLSVEVLAQIWASFLVSPEMRKTHGIHRTPRSIVKYITNRIPFDAFPQDSRYVVEPCSGSATFLVGALDHLRDLLPASWSPQRRHTYFRQMLKGFEKDSFGREIGRLCLALADYPEGNGWNIEQGDVFTSPSFAESLGTARVVLCNPPFENFKPEEITKSSASTPIKPAELLNRVLTLLHSDGVLGFVLPRQFIDGASYRGVRKRIAERFDHVDIVALPDKAWADADKETALVIATEPKHTGRTTVNYSVVRERQWYDFDQYHEVGASDRQAKTPDDASHSLAVRELREVWEFLSYCDTLGEHARLGRGVEWQAEVPQGERIINAPRSGWHKGFHPHTKHLRSFFTPPQVYLDFREESRRGGAFDLPWGEPKVVMNKAAKSRTPWRLAAVADFDGFACAQNYIALWPTKRENTLLISAILNGPVANAFVTATEGKTDITMETVREIPFPIVTDTLRSNVEQLIAKYRDSVAEEDVGSANRILRELDAAVSYCQMSCTTG